ncbi:hypothetical protein BDW22DRAFT_939482 [Trametopsis cervina]|nr:hypothetical protein BDW22DRAFT_939482 [Trametopsis cervina]
MPEHHHVSLLQPASLRMPASLHTASTACLTHTSSCSNTQHASHAQQAEIVSLGRCGTVTHRPSPLLIQSAASCLRPAHAKGATVVCYSIFICTVISTTYWLYYVTDDMT